MGDLYGGLDDLTSKVYGRKPDRSGGGGRRRWTVVLLVIAAGVVGAAIALSLFAKGTYTVTPLRVELSAKPALQGSTQLTVRPEAASAIGGIQPGIAEAGTHQAPVTFGMTVVSLGVGSELRDPAIFSDPERLATFIRTEGSSAIADFGRRLALIGFLGGAMGGLAVSMGRWKRILGGALAGLVALGLTGLLLHQTYDLTEFRNARFVVSSQALGTPEP